MFCIVFLLYLSNCKHFFYRHKLRYMFQKHFIFGLFCLIAFQISSAQDKPPVKFGDVSAKDFETKVYSIDSNASAVVIADVGSCTVEGNRKGWFSVLTKHYKRVHILNKNGYDLANVSIRLFSNGEDEEILEKLKAITYNLEGGKVVETKLDNKSGVFEDKLDKKNKIKKFTFPNIKEGSILEFEYTTTSDFINTPDPWEFQGAYPRLWSEFTFNVPVFFNYTFLTQGYLPYTVRTAKEEITNFNITDPGGTGPSAHYSFSSRVIANRWAIKDVPALKEESYTTTVDNHIQKIAFELVERSAPLAYYRYIEAWPKVANNYLNYEYFGYNLTRENNFLRDISKSILTGSESKEVMSRKIFEWVRNNFTCTNYHRVLMDHGLKAVAKAKSGTVAEINLLLTALLLDNKIEADPVVLSTRSNGFAYSIFPLMSQYDYVICRAKINDKYIMLDASEPQMGYGFLPLRCYNGYARVMSKMAPAIDLLADSVNETKSTLVFVVNEGNGKYAGSMQQTPGYYESLDIRDKIKSKGVEQLQKDIKSAFGSDVEISNFGVDSLKNLDGPIGIHYDFMLDDVTEDIVYINPLFGEGYKDNPFKSAERKYPIEMPYAMDETYTLQMEVPQGYIVDELPKSMVLKLNEQEDGLFEYRLSHYGESISMRCRLVFKKANFLPEEYELLREFFSMVVKKQSEQIVFKKKK